MLAFLFFISPVVYGQDMAGVVTDNYSGLPRAMINPALIADSPNCLEINLFTGNVGLQNDYFYIPSEYVSLRDFANERFPLHEETGRYVLDRYPRERMFGFQNLRLQGPSVMVRYDRHVFGISNGFRSMSSARRLPGHMLKFAAEGLTYSPQHNISYEEPRPFSAATLSWAETGITYATRLFDRQGHTLSIGITAKRLWAYHGGKVRFSDLEYSVNENRDIIIENMDLTVDAALPLNYDNNEFTGTDDFVKGRGFSFDLGFTYARSTRPQTKTSRRGFYTLQEYEPYAYRIGVSLLDLGAVRLKTNTRSYNFENTVIIWEDPTFSALENLEGLVSEIENQWLIEGEIESLEDTQFTVFLPSAASFQFDYNLGNNFFAHAFLIQDLPLVKNRVSRPSSLGFVPRYESRWFGVSLPMTLHQYRKPRLGMAVRLGYLTIGSDQPGGLLKVNDLDGFDLYVSLNIPLSSCRRDTGKKLVAPCYY